MKILVVTPRVPYPPNRGDKLRIFNIIKTLAKNHSVTVVSFAGDEKEISDNKELLKLGIKSEYVVLNRLKSYLNLVKSVFTTNPMQVSFYGHKQMRKLIQKLTSYENYDIVYFHLLITAQYHSSVADINALKILDQTDATSLFLERYLEFLDDPIKRLYFKYDFGKVKKYEKILSKFDTVFVCSEIDRKHLQNRNPSANVQLFMNGFDQELYKYKVVAKEKNRLIFTGNMPYFPNKDGVLFFINEVLPILLKSKPDIKFYVVGQNPPDEILELQSDNVIVTGFVPDIKAEYLKSEINVAPIRFGSGTPNKIIEAMALGVPTVATSMTISGFPTDIKKHVFTADAPEKFAEQILYLLDNKKNVQSEIEVASNVIREILSLDYVVGKAVDFMAERIKLSSE